MSVLEIPRIYFKGQISWDPVTTNNYTFNYDETDGLTILPPNIPRIQDDVQAFRELAITQIETHGNWNPHGTYRSSFLDTTVCGFDRGLGTSTADPFATTPVNFTGMLVDCEPYGTYSSQLFFDSMLFGVEGGNCIRLPRTSRITDRLINFSRGKATQTMTAGLASVSWTTSFAKTDGLKVESFDSGILRDLAAALEPDDVLGLTVRFNTYRTTYFDDPSLVRKTPQAAAAEAELVKKMGMGGFQPNPARSVVVGVIGLWRRGEPAHEPGDRALVPSTPAYQMAGASARLTEQAIVLDLSNSVPETNGQLDKADLGPLTVVAVDSAGAIHATLGSIPYSSYDKQAYEASAGIVTLPLAAGVARKVATLDLRVNWKAQSEVAGAEVLLAEERYRALPDIPNYYLDQGHPGQATFRVLERGVPAAAGVTFKLNLMSADGGTVESSAAMITGPGGLATMQVPASTAGITAYVPNFTQKDAPATGLNTQINTYMYVRVRPADADIAALQPTWANVYGRVLANWNAMAPCMDNWLRLDDPAQMRQYAVILKRLTDPGYFEAYRFMPITRDMSVGMRSLLYAWLDSPVDAANEPPPRVRPRASLVQTKALAAPEATAPGPPLDFTDQTRLSRAMRGGK